MIGSLVQGLVGVIVDEVAAQGDRRIHQQREGSAMTYPQQQRHQPHRDRQQHLPPGPLASLAESMSELFNRMMATVVTAFQYLLLLEALLLSSVVLYSALYWMVMPLRLHDKPIFLDYSSRLSGGGATGTVDFLARHTQWDPSSLTSVERLNSKVLQPGQHYKVGLELQMPTSYTNRRVGVFMVHTTLLDDHDNELAVSARPAMLPHTSALRKGVGMLFSWPLHLLGLKQEADTVHLECMDYYEENAEHPLAKARVSVSSGRVQFYRSSINITPELKGLPWLMHDWFYSTLAVGVLFIASLELMLFGFCYVFFFLTLKDERKICTTNTTGGVRTTAEPTSRRNHGRSNFISTYSRRHASGPSGEPTNHRGGSGLSSDSGRHSSSSVAPATNNGNSCSGRSSSDIGPSRASPERALTYAAVPVPQNDGLRRRTTAGSTRGNGREAESSNSPSPVGVDEIHGMGESASAPAAAAATAAAIAARSPTVVEAAQASQSSSPGSGSYPPAGKQPSTLPPTVHAYHKGARYVTERGATVRGGEGGVGGGGGISRSSSRCDSTHEGPENAAKPFTGVRAPHVDDTSREEVHAATMASWMDLFGNIVEPLKGGGGPRGIASGESGSSAGAPSTATDGKGISTQGLRIVESEAIHEEIGLLDRSIEVRNEGATRLVETDGSIAAAASAVDGIDDGL